VRPVTFVSHDESAADCLDEKVEVRVFTDDKFVCFHDGGYYTWQTISKKERAKSIKAHRFNDWVEVK